MDINEEAIQLGRVPLFSKLDNSKLKLIAFTSEQISIGNGQILFHQNDPSDSVYLVLDGAVEVLSETPEGEYSIILELGTNMLIGEMGVISNAPRSATIRASDNATLLRIEADTFMNLLSENPPMSLHVMRELTDKLSKSHMREVKLREREARI